MRESDLEYVTRGTTCAVERRSSGGFHAAHCTDPADKVVLLERLAEVDVRRDPRVRRQALELLRMVRRGPDGRHDPRQAAEVFHQFVRDRVPYVGEGVETFQPTMTTLRYGGDCDDSARALRALCMSVSLPSRYETLQKCGGGRCVASHIATQIWDGRAWQWAETTIKAGLGEHPRAALRRLRALGMAPALRPDLAGPSALGDLDFGASVKCASLPVQADRDARKAIVDAWGLILTAPPASPGAVQYVQAVCRLESQYGKGWVAPGHAHLKDSKNWGGVQQHGSPVADLFKPTPERPRPTIEDVDATGIVCPSGSALGYDSKSSGMFYAVCFKTYVDDSAGAFDVLREIFKRPQTRAALATGDTMKISTAMYDEHYFGGFGDREHAISQHAARIDCDIAAIAKALGEPIACRRGGRLAAPSSRALIALAGAAAIGGGGYLAWRSMPSLRRAFA